MINDIPVWSLPMMLAMGFTGSLHCIGMCGGLVSAVSMGRRQVWWSGLFVYQLGRVSTYAMLGLLVGLSGVALSRIGGDIVQRLMAAMAGVLMVAFAMNLAGWLPDLLRHLGLWASRKIGLAQLAARVSGGSRITGWYALGLINGLLPCGLVYAALSLALAAGNAASAILMMISFGLGTIPAMMFVPSVFHKMTPALRQTSMRMAAALIMIMGLITFSRSFMHG